MRVAYISDLHLDSWIKCRENQEDFEDQLNNQMFTYLEFLLGSENIQNFKDVKNTKIKKRFHRTVYDFQKNKNQKSIKK